MQNGIKSLVQRMQMLLRTIGVLTMIQQFHTSKSRHAARSVCVKSFQQNF